MFCTKEESGWFKKMFMSRDDNFGVSENKNHRQVAQANIGAGMCESDKAETIECILSPRNLPRQTVRQRFYLHLRSMHALHK